MRRVDRTPRLAVASARIIFAFVFAFTGSLVAFEGCGSSDDSSSTVNGGGSAGSGGTSARDGGGLSSGGSGGGDSSAGNAGASTEGGTGGAAGVSSRDDGGEDAGGGETSTGGDSSSDGSAESAPDGAIGSADSAAEGSSDASSEDAGGTDADSGGAAVCINRALCDPNNLACHPSAGDICTDSCQDATCNPIYNPCLTFSCGGMGCQCNADSGNHCTMGAQCPSNNCQGGRCTCTVDSDCPISTSAGYLGNVYYPAPKWQPGHAYAVGNRISNNWHAPSGCFARFDHWYECTVAGTSAATGNGPSGTATNIADGTVVWRSIFGSSHCSQGFCVNALSTYNGQVDDGTACDDDWEASPPGPKGACTSSTLITHPSGGACTADSDCPQNHRCKGNVCICNGGLGVNCNDACYRGQCTKNTIVNCE